MADTAGKRLVTAAQISAGGVALLFLIEGVDQLLRAIAHSPGSPLDRYGIVPRTLLGLRGILFSPLLHANFAHVGANALPLFVLLTLFLADTHYHRLRSLTMIWLLSGLGTWLIGRGNAVHIGASSLIYGLVAYLVVAGWLMKSWRSALVALFVLFLYGGIAYGVLPQAGAISWEGHLCGAVAGVWAARRPRP
jgi:membrane associated rhomboid family serine protease